MSGSAIIVENEQGVRYSVTDDYLSDTKTEATKEQPKAERAKRLTALERLQIEILNNTPKI